MRFLLRLLATGSDLVATGGDCAATGDFCCSLGVVVLGVSSVSIGTVAVALYGSELCDLCVDDIFSDLQLCITVTLVELASALLLLSLWVAWLVVVATYAPAGYMPDKFVYVVV